MKYITSILLLLVTLLCSCSTRQSPDEIEKFHIKNRQLGQSEFESDSHKYKVFTMYNNKYFSVVHDPDCDCHSH